MRQYKRVSRLLWSKSKRYDWCAIATTFVEENVLRINKQTKGSENEEYDVEAVHGFGAAKEHVDSAGDEKIEEFIRHQTRSYQGWLHQSKRWSFLNCICEDGNVLYDCSALGYLASSSMYGGRSFPVYRKALSPSNLGDFISNCTVFNSCISIKSFYLFNCFSWLYHT
jgi:hypothetical protein